jgi:hypothetical protein
MRRNARLAVLVLILVGIAIPAIANKAPLVQIDVLKSMHKQKLVLQAVISQQKVVLECSGRCPEIATGKYVGFVRGNHVDLEFPVPLSKHVEKVTFTVAGSW